MNIQMVERDVTHAERVDMFREAISQIRVAAFLLVDAGLFGASDEVGRCIVTLERQFRLFNETTEGQRARASSPLAESRRQLLSPHRKGRRGGIDVVPGSVKQARQEAGLSLAKVAGTEVTRTAVWYIETGKTRPSAETLRLIADRTGKPLDFFLEAPRQ